MDFVEQHIKTNIQQQKVLSVSKLGLVYYLSVIRILIHE